MMNNNLLCIEMMRLKRKKEKIDAQDGAIH